MQNYLAFTAILVFILGIVIMYLIPESMFPKKTFSEHIDGLDLVKENKNPGYYKIIFIIGGLISLAIIFFIQYVIL